MVNFTADEITHRRILKIAIPILLSNATVPILGAVDTGVIGQLGEAAPIGAVGLGSIIITTIYGLFGFLRMGTSGLASQEKGKGDDYELSMIIFRSLMIGFVLGVLVLILHFQLFYLVMKIVPASPEVERLTEDYVSIRIFSAPAAIATYGITGWLIAQERTQSVLVLQLAMNGLNVILDILFVLGLNYGVEGVAYATLIAEWFALFLGLYLCREALWIKFWEKIHRIFDRAKFNRMVSVNSDILIRSLFLGLALVSFLFLSSDFGDITLAANQILLQFLFFTAYALDGFAFSSETLVGQSIGAENKPAVRKSSLLTSVWGMITAVIVALVFALTGPMIITIMTTEPMVRIEAMNYLWWVVLVPIIGGPSWFLDGIFIGATKTREMRNGMMISFFFYVIALVITMPTMENAGLWLSLYILFILRALTLGLKYPNLERMDS
ncbi:MAG: MATE family efflux transporter [Paracoccaceae bacterium]|nr:MATE family efflux transporter [Paracoccaceae bacterium]MDE2917816.1 MATE family efflux transporter [Paracoccaceae bacterium]